MPLRNSIKKYIDATGIAQGYLELPSGGPGECLFGPKQGIQFLLAIDLKASQVTSLALILRTCLLSCFSGSFFSSGSGAGGGGGPSGVSDDSFCREGDGSAGSVLSGCVDEGRGSGTEAAGGFRGGAGVFLAKQVKKNTQSQHAQGQFSPGPDLPGRKVNLLRGEA